jgi:hypothetical protein
MGSKYCERIRESRSSKTSVSLGFFKPRIFTTIIHHLIE